MHVELRKRLNLLRQSPSIVMKETGHRGEAELIMPEQLPDGSGICWLAGETTLNNGVSISSVFQVDTDSGGTLLATYWWISQQWFLQGDAALKALGFAKKDAYPYDWEYCVPLRTDIFHQ